MKIKSLFHGIGLAGFALLSLLLSSPFGLAQAQTDSVRTREIFTVVEQNPKFVSCMEAYQSYMRKKVRQLKNTASQKLTGIVFFSFVVTEQGPLKKQRL